MKNIWYVLIFLIIAFNSYAQNIQLPEEVTDQLLIEETDLLNNEVVYDSNSQGDQYYFEKSTRGGSSDTIIGYNWKPAAGDWIPKKRIIKVFDENNLLVKELFQFFQPDHKWQNGLLKTFLYDEAGHETEKVVQAWDQRKKEWVNYFRIKRIFETGLLSKIRTQVWNLRQKEWENKHALINTYAGEVLIADTAKVWKHFEKKWQQKFLNEYTYENSHLIEKTTFTWLPYEHYWAKLRRSLFGYNENNQLQVVTHQVWFHGNMQNPAFWANTKRIEMTWEGDLKSSVLQQDWKKQDSLWINRSLTQFSYDNAGKLTERLDMERRHDELELTNKRLATFTYDDAGNLVSKLIRVWNREMEDWENFKLWEYRIGGLKNSITSQWSSHENEISVLCRNPLNSSDIITITGLIDDYYEFSLTDVAGSKVFSIPLINSETITIGKRMPAGIYIMTITHDNQMVFSRKILMEQ